MTPSDSSEYWETCMDESMIEMNDRHGFLRGVDGGSGYWVLPVLLLWIELLVIGCLLGVLYA